MSELYIILGTPGSGRRDIAAQLLDGLPGGARVYVSRAENPDPADATLAALDEVEVMDWFTDGANLEITDAQNAPDRVVFITEGARNPVDQMEILAALAPRLGWSVTRVITVVDCRLAHAKPALDDWFKACIHFSDAVLLNRREGVPPSFDRDFSESYRKSCAPALFEKTKKGRVPNPDLILLPEARRLSQIFDEDRDPLDDMEFDEDNLPDQPFDLVNKTDPYFERDDRGQRRLRIPNIRDFLA